MTGEANRRRNSQYTPWYWAGYVKTYRWRADAVDSDNAVLTDRFLEVVTGLCINATTNKYYAKKARRLQERMRDIANAPHPKAHSLHLFSEVMVLAACCDISDEKLRAVAVLIWPDKKPRQQLYGS
jgi:hypothetical protein